MIGSRLRRWSVSCRQAGRQPAITAVWCVARWKQFNQIIRTTTYARSTSVQAKQAVKLHKRRPSSSMTSRHHQAHHELSLPSFLPSPHLPRPARRWAACLLARHVFSLLGGAGDAAVSGRRCRAAWQPDEPACLPVPSPVPSWATSGPGFCRIALWNCPVKWQCCDRARDHDL